MKRYVCDGYHDCKGGEDESEGECGMYVCYFKLLVLSSKSFYLPTDALYICLRKH